MRCGARVFSIPVGNKESNEAELIAAIKLWNYHHMRQDLGILSLKQTLQMWFNG
jgi:hypothetical protein